MPIPEWFIGYFVGIAALQLMMFWYLIRRRGGTSERAAELEEGEVVCPKCDTRNDTSYRYCRSCVGELPGTRPGATGLTAPVRRWIR